MDSYYTRMLYLLEAGSEECLLKEVEGTVRFLGFDCFAYARRIDELSPSGEQRLQMYGTYPDSWLQRYAELRFDRIDPCFIHATKHLYPIPWSRGLFSGGDAAGFYEEAMAHGVSAGALSPCSRSAALGIARAEEADNAMDDVVHALGQIHMLGSFLHTAMDRLIFQRGEEESPHLTNRERQCLQLATLGKRDAYIAKKLRISERTVLMHLANAARKLGAKNRSQMTAKSILMGIISI